ncbi:hypothetical protein P9112_001802 [Eukaryota sp. TZLM1-RC]
MAESQFSLDCAICAESFNDNDRKPLTVCANGHCICSTCSPSLSKCPYRCDLLASPIPNIELMRIASSITKSVNQVPEISPAEISIEPDAFSQGSFADVHKADYNGTKVAVKLLRFSNNKEDLLKKFQREVNLAIGLNCTNIVKVYGVITHNKRMGIVMELCDATLNEVNLTDTEKLHVAQGIISGMLFLHSRNIVHRDVKPENVLMKKNDRGKWIPKIADFGTSKIIHTIRTNTSSQFTVKYAAPELFNPGMGHLTLESDVYSVSNVLIFLFSGIEPYFEGSPTANMMQVMMLVSSGKRPVIPESVPESLRPLIERGMDADPDKRTKLNEFESCLQQLSSPSQPSQAHGRARGRINRVPAGMLIESQNPTNYPTISIQWPDNKELLNSKEARVSMVEAIRSSHFGSMALDTVLTAMTHVPRHLYLYRPRANDCDDEAAIDMSYDPCRPIPATPISNESSPEIIAVQLSLVSIEQGHSVALIGAKGGYILALICQLVGLNGFVHLFSGSQQLIDINRERCNDIPFQHRIDTSLVEDMENEEHVGDSIDESGRLYDCIICCGALEMGDGASWADYLSIGGKLLTIVSMGNVFGGQQFFVHHKVDHDEINVTEITEFGVRFQSVRDL